MLLLTNNAENLGFCKSLEINKPGPLLLEGLRGRVILRLHD
jgi:hypothetical protein